VEFLSMLTTWKVFQEIHVKGLFVGHTHEDINMHYNYLSKQLKTMNAFVLANLMKTFIESQLIYLYQIWSRRLMISNIPLNVTMRSLWDWRKCFFSCSLWTTMKDIFFNTRNVYLIQSGCCETSRFACGRMMVAFTHSFLKTNHPLAPN
jgi:hypothetical protein